jgi:hypothetical protein
MPEGGVNLFSDPLSAALTYAESDWFVFPLHTPQQNGLCDCRKDCSSPGKHPRTMNGLNGASNDPEQIRLWWQMWPQANVGIATGAKSGFFVLDVDEKHGGRESIKTLVDKHGLFPERIYQRTGGGGWHILFKHPGIRIGNVQNSDRLGKGIDVRGDGGYIVVAPSLHPSGKRYEWGSGLKTPPEAPHWLVEALRKPEPTFQYSSIGDIQQGARNNTLTSLAGSMRRKGISEGAICAALKVENLQRCMPPLADVDVERIARSIARYSPEAPIQASDPEYGEGIFTVKDLSDAVDELYEQGLTAGASTGWRNVDSYYTVKRGQWTILVGVPSHGKSSWLDALMVNLAMQHGWKFCICSPENQPIQRHIASLMSQWAGEPFSSGLVERMSVKTKDEAKAWVQEHFVFILPLLKDFNVEGVLDLVSEVKTRHPVDGVVIDPWNELEHQRPANMNETEYISQSLSFMRKYARAQDLHLWLVVHPTKLQKDRNTRQYPVPTLYDAHGSAHFRNKADMGVVVWRDLQDESKPTEIHVQKVRFKECGTVGVAELYYDRVTGRFSEEVRVHRPAGKRIELKYD